MKTTNEQKAGSVDNDGKQPQPLPGEQKQPMPPEIPEMPGKEVPQMPVTPEDAPDTAQEKNDSAGID